MYGQHEVLQFGVVLKFLGLQANLVALAQWQMAGMCGGGRVVRKIVDDTGRRGLALLYGCNTLGAVVGAGIAMKMSSINPSVLLPIKTPPCAKDPYT